MSGASQTPSSNTGRELTFDIGNLAVGATASVTIDVRVDETFSGTLINAANVRGNETEITLRQQRRCRTDPRPN